MKPSIISSIVVAIIIIAGAFVLSGRGDENKNVISENNVSIVDGKQIIEVAAKGGYFPMNTVAKAGIPTVLRFNTSGTLDCSSSVTIPSMNISKQLSYSGITEMDLGSPKAGILQGMCSMGMYPFQIDFQN